MKQETCYLGARLRAIADRVREGVVLYDIGTDHAYLPVYLLQQGRIARAVASDVATGPLACASETVRRAELSDLVKLCLADGLQGMDLVRPCDVSIAGMGGEMIVSILSRAPQVKDVGVRLLLQPMTKVEELRRFLADQGFAVDFEGVVMEGKLYSFLTCTYTGVPYTLDEEELLLGCRAARQEDELFFAMAEAKMAVLRKVMEGKKRGGEDASLEEGLLARLTELLKKEIEDEGKRTV